MVRKLILYFSIALYLITFTTNGNAAKHIPYEIRQAVAQCRMEKRHYRPGFTPSCDRVKLLIKRLKKESEIANSDTNLCFSRDIKNILVRKSISNYKATGKTCPCPYSIDRSNRVCGKRSAYTRIGGANPYCYTSDIKDSVVKEYMGRSGC